MPLHPASGRQALEKAARDGDPSRIVMSLLNTTSKTYSVCVMSNEPMLITIEIQFVYGIPLAVRVASSTTVL
jgi:hypothetical protein